MLIPVWNISRKQPLNYLYYLSENGLVFFNRAAKDRDRHLKNSYIKIIFLSKISLSYVRIFKHIVFKSTIFPYTTTV